MNLKRGAICCITAAALSGCLLPDKYDATIEIRKDGFYSTEYDGEATMVIAYVEYKKPGANKAKIDQEMRSFEAELNRGKGVAAKHQGEGRFTVKVREQEKLPANGTKSLPLELGKVTSHAGEITVQSETIGARDLEGMKKAGLNSVGDICIKTDLEVISHNANSTPGIFSRCYKWSKFDILSGRKLSLKAKAS